MSRSVTFPPAGQGTSTLPRRTKTRPSVQRMLKHPAIAPSCVYCRLASTLLHGVVPPAMQREEGLKL